MATDGRNKEAQELHNRARCRERLLLDSFHLIREGWSSGDQDQCSLNPQLLRMVSESYFKDLEKKKHFHDIGYADAHKRAGYMCKWIMRFRPAQLISESAGMKPLLANEHFALTVALRFLELSPANIPPELYRCLIYALRYRHIDGNAWALSFFLLQEAYKK